MSSRGGEYRLLTSGPQSAVSQTWQRKNMSNNNDLDLVFIGRGGFFCGMGLVLVGFVCVHTHLCVWFGLFVLKGR